MARQRISPISVEIQIDDPVWRAQGRDLLPNIKRAVHLASGAAGQRNRRGSLTILLTDDDRVSALNSSFRAKNGPTNVLSFPSCSPAYLGDIAIASGVTAREAEAADIPVMSHLLHLTVHGVLHLLGYDHELASDAEIMESMEADILAQMSIPNPYIRQGRAA